MKYGVVYIMAKWFLYHLKIYAITVIIAMGLFILGAGIYAAFSMDRDGEYAKKDPALHAWFDSLTNQNKSPCCSFADGITVSDIDVDTYSDDKGSHYKVRVPGGTLPSQPKDEWVNVPDDAVVTTPNKFGPPVIWPYLNYDDGKTTIRCFLPGAGA